MVCKLTQEQLQLNKKLNIHHIDYNKNNSNPNNLISLCVNCHMITNGNRKYWTKVFQEIIRKNYLEEMVV